MKELAVLGIMSGTSIDAVDYALCGVTDRSIRLREFWTAKYPQNLRAKLHQAARGNLSSHALAQLHHDAGRFFAENATRRKNRPDLAGLHGQTIFHQPEKPRPATFQLGEPAYLVEALRAPVVNNFRAADLAAGGQGAPLATAFHVQAFGQKGQHVCVQNLGGIGNVTSIDWKRGKRPNVLSFDTGPANMLLDLTVRHFSGGRKHMDRDGAMARRGKPAADLIDEWLTDRFVRKAPPKSTGREYFGEPFLGRALKAATQRSLRPEDLLATFTEFTAQSIALNYELHLPAKPERIILAGGGAKNGFLTERLCAAMEQTCPGTGISSSDAAGWPSSAIEPAAFAWLAFLRVHNTPGNLPTTTGANRAAVLGQLSVY